MWELQIPEIDDKNSSPSPTFQESSSNSDTCTDTTVSIKHIETDFENRIGLQSFCLLRN